MKKIGSNAYLHIGVSPYCVKLRYDGRYEFVKDQDNRSYTIMSDFFDEDGANRIGSSFMHQALKDRGVF